MTHSNQTQTRRTSKLKGLWNLGLAACLSFSLLGASTGHAQSSTSERLTLQSSIDHHVFLNEAIFPWAHNAYNSDSSTSGYGYAIPNQSETITTMLNAGLRLIDLDLVWADFEVRMCHGLCAGGEATFETRLKEVKDWFDADPSRYDTEVVILHVESVHIDTAATWRDMSDYTGCHYHIAVDDIRDSGIDDLVYKPDSTCTEFTDLAASITKADVLSAGKNVIFIGADDSNCGFQCMEVLGETDKWGHWVFNKIPVNHTIDHVSFTGYPNCSGGGFVGHDAFTAAYNDIVGIFHTENMSEIEMDALVGCGVNGISYEKFVNDDYYHQAQVWSWDTDKPSGTASGMDCAELSGSGMEDVSCSQTERIACQNVESGEWKQTVAHASWINGQQACYEEFGLGYVFAVPANGYQANLALENFNETLWVNYSDSVSEGDWTSMLAATEVLFDLEAGDPHGTIRGTSTFKMASNAGSTADRLGNSNGALSLSQTQQTLVKGYLNQEFGAHATVSVWFKMNSGANSPSGARLVEFSETGGAGSTGILMNPNGAVFTRCEGEDDIRRGVVSTGNPDAGYTGPTTFKDGQWHHAAYVTDGTISKLYVDGQLAASTTNSCSDLADSYHVSIGSNSTYRDQTFDGAIDEVAIYGAALSEADIVAMSGGYRTPAVGGDWGSLFSFVVNDDSGEYIEKVRIRSGTRLDAIRIETDSRDSGWFGGGGGNASSLTLGSGEFINKVTVCEDYTGAYSDNTVHYLKLETNLGNSLVGGRYRGSCSVLIDGERFLGIHGASATEVNRLGVYYGTPIIRARYNTSVCLVKEDNNWNNGNDLVLGNCSAATDAFKGWEYEASTGYIRSTENPSKCLHKQWGNGNWNNGNPVHVWGCNQGSSENKTWDYDPSTGYIMARQNNSKCMHKKYSNNWESGNLIHLWSCSSGPSANKSWDLF